MGECAILTLMLSLLTDAKNFTVGAVAGGLKRGSRWGSWALGYGGDRHANNAPLSSFQHFRLGGLLLPAIVVGLFGGLGAGLGLWLGGTALAFGAGVVSGAVAGGLHGVSQGSQIRDMKAQARAAEREAIQREREAKAIEKLALKQAKEAEQAEKQAQKEAKAREKEAKEIQRLSKRAEQAQARAAQAEARAEQAVSKLNHMGGAQAQASLGEPEAPEARDSAASFVERLGKQPAEPLSFVEQYQQQRAQGRGAEERSA